MISIQKVFPDKTKNISYWIIHFYILKKVFIPDGIKKHIAHTYV
jgi:hypothetical protein